MLVGYPGLLLHARMPRKREITSNIHRLAPAYLGGEADEIWRLPRDVGSLGDFSREFGEGRIRGGGRIMTSFDHGDVSLGFLKSL
jgi:hypothetical protein